MENASAAFLDAVRKSMRQIRSALGAAFIDPTLLTAAERLQYEGNLRREEVNAAILAWAEGGATIKEIVGEMDQSRGLVRKILRGQRSDIFRTRESSLEPHLPWLDAQWAAGSRNGAELWRRLRASGFRGSLRVVSEGAPRRRRAKRMDEVGHRCTPLARTIARLMTTGRDALSKTENAYDRHVRGRGFRAGRCVRRRHHIPDYDPHEGSGRTRRLDRPKTGLLASFVNGVMKDRAAFAAPIVTAWSNGQTEGQITKLKLIKHQNYGRANLDLLEARLIGAQ